MSRPSIAWYVHHHGQGHVGRLRAIAPHLDADVVCFSSLPEPAGLPGHCTWVRLERDDEVEPGRPEPARSEPTAHGLLHWAPLRHGGHRNRLTRMAEVADARGVTAFVVDVSVEVTLLARLLGIPPVVIAQPGVRDDEPHALGLRVASRVIAPWPEDLLRPAHLEPVRDRTVYTGGISRFEGRTRADDQRAGVLLLSGRGGAAVGPAEVEAATRATPGRRWTLLGAPASPGARAAWSDDPWHELARAETVVAWAGQNSIADLAVAGARAVVVPQPRPFDEQVQTAQALHRAGLAVVEPSWPAAERWPEVLDRVATLDPDWSRWRTAGAAARAAEAVDAVARGRVDA
ncbi:glycosyltransferase [Cellulomonas sp. Marseille-Q8402]